MAKCETFQEITQLRNKLYDHTTDLAVLTTAPTVALQQANQQQALDMQTKMRKLIGRMSVAYVFTLLEDSKFSFLNNKWLTDAEKERLMAWRHIRNSATHTAGDGRAETFKNEFNAVMAGPEPFNCVLGHDIDTLVVASNAGFAFLDEAAKLMDELITRSFDSGPTQI